MFSCYPGALGAPMPHCGYRLTFDYDFLGFPDQRSKSGLESVSGCSDSCWVEMRRVGIPVSEFHILKHTPKHDQ